MVNLFSFGWHVIDRAYVRTRLQIVRVGLGRLSKGREGCLRHVSENPHLLHCTFTIWSIDSCQNRIATDQYHMTISRAHVSTHRGDVIYLEAVRWPVNCFTRSLLMFNLILSSQFGSTGKLIMHTYYILVMHTYFKTGYPLTSITWPYRGLRCRPIEVKYYFEVIRWQVTRFQMIAGSSLIFLKLIWNMLSYVPHKNRCRTRKFSQPLQAGKTVAFDLAHHGHALCPIFMLWLVKNWQVSSRGKFFQHLEPCLLCLLWQLKLFFVNLWCF